MGDGTRDGGAGKGDLRRPTDDKKYQEGYDRIFKKNKKKDYKEKGSL